MMFINDDLQKPSELNSSGITSYGRWVHNDFDIMLLLRRRKNKFGIMSLCWTSQQEPGQLVSNYPRENWLRVASHWGKSWTMKWVWTMTLVGKQIGIYQVPLLQGQHTPKVINWACFLFEMGCWLDQLIVRSNENMIGWNKNSFTALTWQLLSSGILWWSPVVIRGREMS